MSQELVEMKGKGTIYIKVKEKLKSPDWKLVENRPFCWSTEGFKTFSSGYHTVIESFHI